MKLFLNQSILELDGIPNPTPAQETMLRLLCALRDHMPDAVEEVELNDDRVRVRMSGVSAVIRIQHFSDQLRIEAALPMNMPSELRPALSRQIHRLHGQLFEGCCELEPYSGLCRYRLACHYGRVALTTEQILHALGVAAKETGVYDSMVHELLSKYAEGM